MSWSPDEPQSGPGHVVNLGTDALSAVRRDIWPEEAGVRDAHLLERGAEDGRSGHVRALHEEFH
jgi:hypothetical protein